MRYSIPYRSLQKPGAHCSAQASAEEGRSAICWRALPSPDGTKRPPVQLMRRHGCEKLTGARARSSSLLEISPSNAPKTIQVAIRDQAAVVIIQTALRRLFTAKCVLPRPQLLLKDPLDRFGQGLPPQLSPSRAPTGSAGVALGILEFLRAAGAAESPMESVERPGLRSLLFSALARMLAVERLSTLR